MYDSGKRVDVVVGVAEFEKILEELESIRACYGAKAANDDLTPPDQAYREIEQERPRVMQYSYCGALKER